MLTRESGKFDGTRRCTREVAAHQLEHGGMEHHECACADVGEARDPRLGVANERNRAPDVAQGPQRERQPQDCRDAHILPEAEGQIIIAPGLEQD